MRFKTLLLTSALMASSVSAFSISLLGDKGDYGGNSGSGMQFAGRRMSFAMPSRAAIIDSDRGIEVSLEPNIGVVSASIKNNRGVVISKRIIDTSFDNQLKLDTSHFPVGSYTITFTDLEGSVLLYQHFIVD